jgi:hypothetical protein
MADKSNDSVQFGLHGMHPCLYGQEERKEYYLEHCLPLIAQVAQKSWPVRMAHPGLKRVYGTRQLVEGAAEYFAVRWLGRYEEQH